MATRESRDNASHHVHRHRAQSIIQWDSLDQLEEEVIQGLYENADHHQGSSKKIVVCETFYGYLWWTALHVITVHLCHPTLFTPTIPSLLSLLVISVALLLPSFIFKLEKTCWFVSSPSGLLVVRLLSLLPMLYIQFSGHLYRLIIFCVGGSSIFLAAAGNWWEMSTIDRHRKIFYHFLGLVLFLVLKLWSRTFNPLLTGSSLTTTLQIVGVVVVFLLFILDKRTPILRINDILKTHSPKHFEPVVMDKDIWVWLGVGLGCQLLIVQLLYAEAGIIPRWSGNMAATIFPSIVIFCLCFGFSFSIEKNLHFVTSSQWLSIGVISYLVLIASNGPASYLGGLVLTIHLSGLWPQLYCRVAEVEPYKVLPVAIVTYISLIKLGSLELLNFTISEGLFLPAMIVQWYTLRKWVGFGLKVGRIQKPSEGVRTVKKAPSYTMILGQMIRRLSTVAEMEEDLEQDDKDLVKERKSVHQERMRRLLASETEEIRKFDNKRLKKALLFLSVFGVLGSAYCSMPYGATAAEEKMIGDSVTVSSLSLNAGYNTNGHYNVLEIANLIKNSESNIVCLFDNTREFSGDMMSASVIGEHLSMHVYYSRQRNPRIAMLANVVAASVVSSSKEGIVFDLKAADEQCLTLGCYSTNTIPDQLTKESPSVMVFATKGEDPFDSNKLNTLLSGCDGSFIHFNSLTKHSQTCVNTGGSSLTNMTTIVLSRKLNT